MKVDTKFYEFMKICDTVCSHFDSDNKIVEKLKFIQPKVDLLDEIKRMKDNVELDSLNQAKQINMLGEYTVSLDGFELRVLNEKGEQLRAYTLTQLDELKNILMLVAPRRQSESDTADSKSIEEFVAVQTAILQLNKLFQDLITAGCSFFDSFRASVRCGDASFHVIHKKFSKNIPVTDLKKVLKAIASLQVESSQFRDT